MFRLFGLLLIGLVLFISSIGQKTWANTVNCERTSDDSSGWRSSKFFNQIWPKKLSLKYSEFSEAGGGSKAMLLQVQHSVGFVQTLRLLPNKKAIGTFVVPANYEQTGVVRYRCDISSNQLRTSLQSTQKEVVTAEINNVKTPTESHLKVSVDDYKNHRKVTVNDSKVTQQTVVAYNSVRNGDLNVSEGIVFVSGEWCNVHTTFNIKTKDSQFSVSCPSGYSVQGTFEVLTAGKGEIGTGKDTFGNVVQYKLHPTKGKFAISRQAFNDWIQKNTPKSMQKQQRKRILSDTEIASSNTADEQVVQKLTDLNICRTARNNPKYSKAAVDEAKRRGLKCGVGETSTTLPASSASSQPNIPTSAKLLAAQHKTDELEQQLAALKAEQEKQKKFLSNNTKLPTITIASATTTGAQGVIRGRINDNTGIAELRIDGQKIAVDSNGNFFATTYVPEGGTSVNIEAIDLAGLSSTMSVRVDRATSQTASISFDRLNPLKRKAAINNDALALVIGVSDYKETNAKAIYADSDAKVFQDYAVEKLGVPRNRVKTLVNDSADEKDMLLATKRWLARAAKQGKTDVYIFFAGHGLASDDGSKMYLLPYDGAPELLDDTAILRDRLFSDVAAANPRSVTVFLDTCYSGTTRGTDMLIASRPIAIRALEQSIPDNFTVMTATAGDQTAKPLEEAKHGMFSYFLMKGMEGEADANNDNEITAGELHSYVRTNVIKQSSGSQTPELQGDATRVLVRFQ